MRVTSRPRTRIVWEVLPHVGQQPSLYEHARAQLGGCWLIRQRCLRTGRTTYARRATDATGLWEAVTVKQVNAMARASLTPEGGAR